MFHYANANFEFLEIPNSVTEIGQQAFNSCSMVLTEVKIGNSVIRIGDCAFSDNTELAKIEITGAVNIGKYAFSGCQKLCDIILGSNIETINERAFAGCDNIQNINITTAIPPEMEANSFEDIVYQEATLIVPTNNINDYESKFPWSKFYYIKGNTITSISIALDKTEVEAVEGAEFQLIATIQPDDTTNKTVEWTSSNEEVATVSSDGLVKVLKKGVATITATTTDGTNLSASCEVTCLAGVDEIGTGECYVAVEGNNIKICNVSIGTQIRVFSTNGILIASETAMTSNVLIPIEERGIYIVSVGNKKVKAIIE